MPSKAKASEAEEVPEVDRTGVDALLEVFDAVDGSRRVTPEVNAAIEALRA